MGKVIAGMTMSLDGYIDRNGSAQDLNPDFPELLEAPSFKIDDQEHRRRRHGQERL